MHPTNIPLYSHRPVSEISCSNERVLIMKYSRFEFNCEFNDGDRSGSRSCGFIPYMSFRFGMITKAIRAGACTFVTIDLTAKSSPP